MWGTPPAGASKASLAASGEPSTTLEVTVLGNPVRSNAVSVQINGVGAQPLRVALVSAQGKVIAQQQIATPQAMEQSKNGLEKPDSVRT